MGFISSALHQAKQKKLTNQPMQTQEKKITKENQQTYTKINKHKLKNRKTEK
jgi:hypothetical protein